MAGSAVPSTSEFGKGTRGLPASTLGLTGSGSQLRASQCNCSTMALSPSGERRPLASRRATMPLLQPVAALAASLARSAGDRGRGKETNGARVCGEPAARRFCYSEDRSPPLISDGRLTTCWARFGPGGRRESRPRPLLL
jgi:hypothetical protein